MSTAHLSRCVRSAIWRDMTNAYVLCMCMRFTHQPFKFPYDFAQRLTVKYFYQIVKWRRIFSLFAIHFCKYRDNNDIIISVIFCVFYPQFFFAFVKWCCYATRRPVGWSTLCNIYLRKFSLFRIGFRFQLYAESSYHHLYIEREGLIDDLKIIYMYIYNKTALIIRKCYFGYKSPWGHFTTFPSIYKIHNMYKKQFLIKIVCRPLCSSCSNATVNKISLNYVGFEDSLFLQ